MDYANIIYALAGVTLVAALIWGAFSWLGAKTASADDSDHALAPDPAKRDDAQTDR